MRQRLAQLAVILVAAGSLAAGPAAAQDMAKQFAQAKSAYENRDFKAARQQLRPLAQRGHAPSQYLLGVSYLEGKGTEPDTQRGMRWLGRAARRGHPRAQARLADRYRKGTGVSERPGLAAGLYQKAAEKGLPQAQLALGEMLAQGKGVEEDLVAAFIWLSRAVEQGVEAAKKKRQRLARRMTAAQIERAEAKLERQESPKMAEGGPAGESGNGAGSGTRDGGTGGQRAAMPSEPENGAGGAGSGGGGAAPGQGGGGKQGPGNLATGSGFVVSPDGHILTNAHVVEQCDSLHLKRGPKAKVVTKAEDRDLAILKAPASAFGALAPFRQGKPIELGAPVTVAGFPLPQIIGARLNVTTGNVSGLGGPQKQRSLLQFTAPVQQGNSGGPVLDESGRVVGVVVSKLNAVKAAQLAGSIPQNINFAIQGETARKFLEKNDIDHKMAGAKKLSQTEVADRAKRFTVMIGCQH